MPGGPVRRPKIYIASSCMPSALVLRVTKTMNEVLPGPGPTSIQTGIGLGFWIRALRAGLDQTLPQVTCHKDKSIRVRSAQIYLYLGRGPGPKFE